MTDSTYVALITGASGGIGAAIATALVNGGGKVIITGRDRSALQALRDSLDPTGRHVLAVPADITRSEERMRLVEVAKTWNGGINVLVNNAGVADFGLFADESGEAIEHAFAVNALAPMHLCRALLPHLKRRSSAHIVNVGSVFGTIAYPGHAVYSATKFALRGFSEALRRELADTDIAIHYLAPRATRTAFNAGAVDELNRRLGVATDAPERVAANVMAMLKLRQLEAVIGWPEKFFARLNAVAPRLVDRALSKQLPIIRELAAKPVTPTAPIAIHPLSRRAS